MSVIQEIHRVTKSLYTHIQIPLPKEDREQYIEVIDQYLDERESLLKQLQKPPLEEDQALGQQILTMNSEINIRLKEVYEIIGKDLKEIKTKKETGKKYENPYENTFTDGVFFDKKK